MDVWLIINAGEQNLQMPSVRKWKFFPLRKQKNSERSLRFRQLTMLMLEGVTDYWTSKCIEKKDALTLASTTHINLTPFEK